MTPRKKKGRIAIESAPQTAAQGRRPALAPATVGRVPVASNVEGLLLSALASAAEAQMLAGGADQLAHARAVRRGRDARHRASLQLGRQTVTTWLLAATAVGRPAFGTLGLASTPVRVRATILEALAVATRTAQERNVVAADALAALGRSMIWAALHAQLTTAAFAGDREALRLLALCGRESRLDQLAAVHLASTQVAAESANGSELLLQRLEEMRREDERAAMTTHDTTDTTDTAPEGNTDDAAE